jgi:hypothetical protein
MMRSSLLAMQHNSKDVFRKPHFGALAEIWSIWSAVSLVWLAERDRQDRPSHERDSLR